MRRASVRIERHGDILRVLDRNNWTRALAYREAGGSNYIVVGLLGCAVPIAERTSTSIRGVRALVQGLLRERWGDK